MFLINVTLYALQEVFHYAFKLFFQTSKTAPMMHPVNLDDVDSFHAKYRLDRNLVARTTNNVALGIERLTHQPVVIKSVFNQGSEKLKEANLLRKLRGTPGVIELLDHFHTPEQVHLLITKKFGQISLKRYLKEHPPLSEDKAKALIIQVINTVQECAQLNIFHTQLKTGNFLLDTHQWQVKLTNFNAATYIRIGGFKSTKRRISIGQSPPEYYINKHFYFDGLTVWSIGTLLYEMLFSHKPFYCAHDIISKPCFTKPPKHLSINAQLFIEWCLEKRESDRMTLEQMMRHPWLKNKL